MKIVASFFLVFFVSACSIKNYEHTQSKVIIIKSPKLKFADLGYIRNSGDAIELELFVAGKAIEKITINRLICTHEGCMGKSGFNEEYLNGAYPDDTLQNILLAKPIYGGRNMQKNIDGFEQKIQERHVEITYRVNPHAVVFRDIENHILLKIKDTNE